MNCLTSLFSLVGLPEYIHSDRSMSFLSRGLSEFLMKKGISTSKTTPYHPTGNSQCERTNQTVWKTVKLLLAERKLPESSWELVLPDALHSIRSLLCTSTNSTPHDRFFLFQRRSTNGSSIPDWLFEPGPVLLRRFVRDKSEPLCDKVDLIEANPNYALIRYPDGRESTVSVTDLAPFPKISPIPPTEKNQHRNLYLLKHRIRLQVMVPSQKNRTFMMIVQTLKNLIVTLRATLLFQGVLHV